ncbi:histone-lysine N-methyltransferase SETMAR [Plakobranchus ocellatus]|uniref:Histone-lysine N-methyltransferase SETMAR n=1 Tax=Plakobranchus ocellatus TaxID=259542 RepID=A0AAV3Z5L2_9GAST|nr:histone-lysine N-methyltransferase SETMAR [Plakobranchus ocellatus]
MAIQFRRKTDRDRSPPPVPATAPNSAVYESLHCHCRPVLVIGRQVGSREDRTGAVFLRAGRSAGPSTEVEALSTGGSFEAAADGWSDAVGSASPWELLRLMVEISQRLLQRCQQDNGDEDTTHIGVDLGLGGDFQANNNLFDNLITGDETWVHLNTPETKRDSMTWKHPSSPVTKKFKVQSTLDRLKEAIRGKKFRLLRKGVVLQHDNATPHSANLTQQWLQRYGWEILPHPAHSPDLAPSDFHLFGFLKRHLGGMAFKTEDDLISELRKLV